MRRSQSTIRKEVNVMKDIVIPVWERYALTVTEAAEYYHIGETKLRRLAEEHPDADFIIMNDNSMYAKIKLSQLASK